MDAEKIIQDLNRRFAAPLPEFYKRRIIVWHDEDQEFLDQISDMELTNAKIIALTETNHFYVKKLLNFDDTAGNYLLYVPISYESKEDNWLLDIELYSEEFRADLVSMWMAELSVPQTPALRKCFKDYWKFFNTQARRNKLAALGNPPTRPAQLQLSIMAVLAGIRDAKPGSIIKAVLQSGLDQEENPICREFRTYGIEQAFWHMTARGTGYKVNSDEVGREGGLGHQEDAPSLQRLAMHLLLTASTRTLRQEFLTGLDGLISGAHQAHCYDLVSEWMHGADASDLHEIAEYVESECRLPQRFMKLQIADLADTEIFPCINEVILIKLMTQISDQIIDVDVITKTVEKRRTCAWYDDFRNYYDGLLQAARMQAFFQTHAAGFHTVDPQEVWEAYTSDYYRMDTYYRLFHQCHAESQKSYRGELNDLWNQVTEKVEGLYAHWFLGELGSCWSEACADSLRENGRIPGVLRQTDFYRRRVSSPDAKIAGAKLQGAKLYVIISDAMRYEVAASLAEQLARGTQAKVELSSMEGIFPTITKFGMAALLPHEKLSVALKPGKTERLAVLADGQSTEANNREKLLKAADAKSAALKYKEIIGMKRAERQALVKGMNVVYIYHDTIDEAGHSDQPIFRACDEAITEIRNMVRIITNEFGGANILITADHGFLYTYSPLSEDSKVDKTTESDQDIEVGRRYLIMKKGAQPDYLLPVRFLDGNTEYEAFAPRESIRIKTKGGGLNFVHGGISLQEMVVPLIEYHFLRNDSREYQRNRSKYDTKPVELNILSASRKISNMIFSLNFFQKEPVSANREEATYQLYFTDANGAPVSDLVKLIADKTSDNEQERIYRCSFNLKSRKYSAADDYYLVIADENGMQVTRENFQIDIAFAVDDFDFFS